MSQWTNRYSGFNLAPQPSPQQQQQQQQQQQAQQSVQQQQQQLLLQQQLAAVSVPTAANSSTIGALNTYAQQLAQKPAIAQPGQSIYNNATATLLAQFANSNITNQLTTALAAMQQQQQPQPVQQQIANSQNISYQWSSGRLPAQIPTQQQAQPQQTSPRNVNQFQQQNPQDPRLANRKPVINQTPLTNQSPIQSANTSNASTPTPSSVSNQQQFDVRPLMDLEPLRQANNNNNSNNNNNNQRNQNKNGPNSNYNNNNNNRVQNNQNQNTRFNNNNANDNRNNKISRFQQQSTNTVNNQQQNNSFNNNQPARNLNQQQLPPPLKPTTSTETSSTNKLNNLSASQPLISTRPRSRSPLETTSTRRLSTSSHSTTATTTINTHNQKPSSSRYSIRVPKNSLDIKFSNVSSVKNRYSNLYIPSDFTNCKYSWVNSLPIDRPLKFSINSRFHIMRKETQSIFINDAVYEPDDINHAWTVRVSFDSLTRH